MASAGQVVKIGVRTLLGVCVIAVGVWFYYGKGGVQEANALRAAYAKQQIEIATREARVVELKRSLAAIRNGDDSAMELAARRYGLVGADEYMWKVIPVPALQSSN
ncbi:MAG: septum formation initiator family protein [bacterium]|nr:septum formation initiator family protein [bacterium]